MENNTFKDWLINYIEKKQSTKINKQEIEKNKYVFDNFVNYDNNAPFDSYDRLYALYLIDNHQDDVLNKYDIGLAVKNYTYAKNQYSKVLEDAQIKEEFETYLKGLAYENYEREAISNLIAFINMVHVAKKGKEAVLKDSYQNGGWFGAS